MFKFSKSKSPRNGDSKTEPLLPASERSPEKVDPAVLAEKNVAVSENSPAKPDLVAAGDKIAQDLRPSQKQVDLVTSDDPACKDASGNDSSSSPAPEDSATSSSQEPDFLDTVVKKCLTSAAEAKFLQDLSLKPAENPMSNAELIRGDHIRNAFKSASLSQSELDQLVAKSVERAAAAAKQHPVPILGRFGQGKSSLVNTLLGNSAADVGRYQATTTKINLHPLSPVDDIGNILLCDTPGWEPDKHFQMMQDYRQALKEGGYCVHNVPDVSVFVVAGTPQGMRELSSAVEGRHLTRAYAQFQRSMYAPPKSKLLPAITFLDTVDEETRKKDEAYLMEQLSHIRNIARGQDFEIMEPLYISNKTGEGAKQLTARLIEILTECSAESAKGRPWFKLLEDDFCAEVKRVDEEMSDRGCALQLFHRTVAALAEQHGQTADFPPTPWRTLPAVQEKLRGGIGCGERIFSRQGVMCLGIVAMLWLACSVCSHILVWTFGRQYQYDNYGKMNRKQLRDALGEALPSTFEWEVKGLGEGRHLSPLFERQGVPGMQLELMCTTKDVCSLGLLPPDDWKVDFLLQAGKESKAFSSAFPLHAKNIEVGSALGLQNLTSPSKGAYSRVSVQVTKAIQEKMPKPLSNQTFNLDVSSLSDRGEISSNSFKLAGLQDLSFEIYLSGDSNSLSSGVTSSFYLCGPSGWKVSYRLFMDGLSRTKTSRFESSGFLFSHLRQVCHGFPDFAFKANNHRQAGVEILGSEKLH